MTTPTAPPRLEVRLRSQRALRDAMTYRRMTVRELSLACGRISYRSTIGHLHSGARNTCSAHLARRIEEALTLPPGMLFEVRICITNVETTPTPLPRRGRTAVR